MAPPEHLTTPAPQAPLTAAEIGASLQHGGFTPGQSIFDGGPAAINPVGDYSVRSMGPDYDGAAGINTSYTGLATSPTAAPPSTGLASSAALTGAFGQDTMLGGTGYDALGGGGIFGGFDFGGASLDAIGGGGLGLGGGGLGLGGGLSLDGGTGGESSFDGGGGTFDGSGFDGSGGLFGGDGGDLFGGFDGGGLFGGFDGGGGLFDGFDSDDDDDLDGW